MKLGEIILEKRKTLYLTQEQLADYLGVDRSAMCSELSRMQREGLLSYHKNHFSVHEALE